MAADHTMCMPTWIPPADGAVIKTHPEVCERHNRHASSQDLAFEDHRCSTQTLRHLLAPCLDLHLRSTVHAEFPSVEVLVIISVEPAARSVGPVPATHAAESGPETGSGGGGPGAVS